VEDEGMVAITTDNTLTLPDGRVLGFAEYGPAGGYPILFFHGVPGSRLSALMAGLVGGGLDARVIAVERPGYGLSTYVPRRRISQWPEDVRAVADHLGIDRFAVFGYSGGGPYALATASLLTDRVSAVAVASGMGPVAGAEASRRMNGRQRLYRLAAQHAGWGIRLGLKRLATDLQSDPARFMRRRIERSPAADRAIGRRPEIRAVMQRDLVEAFRGGVRGTQHDIWLLSLAWDFEIEAIEAPVRLWHGSADVVVPAWLGRAVAERIPGAQLSLLPGEGHLLFLQHMDEIIEALLATAVQPPAQVEARRASPRLPWRRRGAEPSPA
jgi:pimeloyl-ACP methyl ester carboxylesterase